MYDLFIYEVSAAIFVVALDEILIGGEVSAVGGILTESASGSNLWVSVLAVVYAAGVPYHAGLFIKSILQLQK